MKYLVKVRDRYYYNRRVPEDLRDYDPRELIRVSLKTDSKEHARRKAVILNDQVEGYWQTLVNEGNRHENSRFSKTVRIARQSGFSYQPMSMVAQLPVQELVERILAANDASPKQIEAVLGGKAEPELTIKEALERFWDFTKNRRANKTANQLYKWKNPRVRAINNLIAVIGNKGLKSITREDIIAFRDWWLNRIIKEKLSACSANKDLINVKNIIETVSDNLKLGLDCAHLFQKITLEKRFTQTRLPLTPEQIRAILHSDKVKKLNKQAFWFLHAAAETGARPTEIVGLLPEDIRLSAEVPHICIVDRRDRPLKTAHSEREIPLTGYALEAFKNMPQGFPKYRDSPDVLTNYLNKFLRKHGLMPSKKHSLYSLRHGFQDRILSVNAPDRVQAELMGHKFARPKYGDGATLQHKKEWLYKVCLKW